MSKYSYALNCGQCVLMDDDKPIGRVLDEVAICFSAEDGVMHKHGPKESVEAWATKHRDAYRRIGCNDLADDIVVMAGRFPLDELNQCLEVIDHSGRLYRRILAGEVRELPLVEPTAQAPARSMRPLRT